MYIWRTGLFAAAALAAGCASEVGGADGMPAGNTGGPGPGGPVGSGGSTAVGPGDPGNPGNPGGPGNPGNPGSPGGGAGPGQGGPNCTPNIPSTSQVPRLTNLQYDRTVRDLLGVTELSAAGNVVPSSRLATDQGGGLTELGWVSYKDVADKIATQVLADPTLKANFMKCTPAAGDTTCFRETIVQFGRRAFRRPLTPQEITRFETLVGKGATITETGAPMEIAKVLLYAFLVSPSFIQRSEIVEVADGAGHFTLSNHEIASRLSYMLWGSMPDPTLDQAADQGQLSTPEQIATQARRMLQDPRAREMVNTFHQAYLVMRAEGRWNTAKRDATLFPKFKESIVPDLTEETLKFFDKISFTPGAGFRDFFLSQLAYVNKDTAPLYGLDPSKFGPELTETMLDASRPGFLTRLGFLVNFSSFTRTNPIYRGAFITKDVLGINVPPPPPGAADTPLPTGADLNTNRKQVNAQTSGDTCKGCHHPYINPPGFVMEAFDAIGMARTTEANGVALDTIADVTIVDGQPPVRVSTPAELMAKIADSPGAMRQYAKRWVGFAYSRENDPLDACTVDRIAAAMMTKGGYTVLDLITDLTQAQPFRFRAVEVTQ